MQSQELFRHWILVSAAMLCLLNTTNGQNSPAHLESPQQRTINAEEYYDLGMNAFGIGDYDEAISNFNQAIEIKPAIPYYYMSRGQCRELKNDEMGALIDYEMVLKLDPENTNAHFKRAWINYKRGSYDRAVEDYSYVIMNSGTQATTSIIFKGMEYNEGGQTVMTGVTTIDKLKADAHNGRALANAAKGETLEAMIDYEKAILLNPSDPNYLVNRGLLSMKLNDKESAKGDFKKALAVFPGHKSALYNLSLIADQSELKAIEQQLYASGDFAVAFSKKGYDAYLSGNYMQALIAYDSALLLRPNHAEDLMNRGLVKSKLNRPQSAIKDFESSLKHKQTLNRNYVHIGNAYQVLKQYEDAVNYYKLYITLEGEDGLVLYNKGIALYKLEMYQEACFDLTKAVELGETRAEKARIAACR